jgi:hypothetical protein
MIEANKKRKMGKANEKETFFSRLFHISFISTPNSFPNFRVAKG